MAYMLPLRFVKVSKDVALCATRIVAIMSTSAHQARETLKNEKRAGTLINAAGRDGAKSAIFLDNGSVVASPISVKTLLSLIARSNLKETSPKRTNNTIRMKVYDVVDEEPNPDYDDEINEVDSLSEEEFNALISKIDTGFTNEETYEPEEEDEYGNDE